MKRNDRESIKEYAQGDKSAFNEIVINHIKSVYNFVYRFSKNKYEAEDITQEVFLKVWKKLGDFDIEKNFKTWIFSIAKNTCIDYLRKKKDIPISFFDNDVEENFLENTVQDEDISLLEKYSVIERQKKLEQSMKILSFVEREIITLKYVNEMSLSEVAEIAELPENTVKSHHRRALLKLKKFLSAPKNAF